MKKQIIALAVASVVAVPAMADITLGAAYAFGYQAVTNDNGGTRTAGFGTDTAAINLKGSHELENGMKVAGAISAGGFARGNAVGGENATLSLSGDFGSFSMGSIEAGSGIRALGGAGAPVNNMEGEVLTGAANIDYMRYTLPAMGPIALSFGYADSIGLATNERTNSMDVRARASLGMVTAQGDYTTWQDDSSSEDRVRISAKADAGMFAVGAGYEVRNYDSATASAGAAAALVDGVALPFALTGLEERTNMIVGASAQVSDMTSVGVNYVEAEWTFKGNANVTTAEASGWTAGVSHDLSSNLNLSANYAVWENVLEDDNTKTTVLLGYSF